jgi:hypothetical protein
MDIDTTDMPIFLTPYLLVEGAIAEVVDCLIKPIVAPIEDRTLTYYCVPTRETNTMYSTLDVYATYGIDPSTNQLIGWINIERIRKQCHLDMRAVAEFQQLACDVLLLMPVSLDYLGSVRQTTSRAWDILKSLKKGEVLVNRPQPVTDPTDQRILQWVTEDPDLTDDQIGQKLGISRQAANMRRNRVGSMGYKVR